MLRAVWEILVLAIWLLKGLAMFGLAWLLLIFGLGWGG